MSASYLTEPAARSALHRSRIWRLLRTMLAEVPRGRGRFALAIVMSALASGATVALMGTSSFLLSKAALHPPILLLQVAIVGVRFFGISRGAFRYVERLTGHDLALRMQGALRQAVYRTLSRTTLLGGRRGDLLVRAVADVDAVLDMVVRVAVPMCAGSLVIIGTSAMLAAYDPASAAVLFATAVVAGVAMPLLAQRMSRRADLAIVMARGRMGAEARQLARTATDLTAYGHDAEAIDRFLAVDVELRRCEANAARARGVATAGQLLASGVAVIAAAVLGGQAVQSGRMAPTLLAVLVLVPLSLHEVLSNFASAAQTLTRASASLRRVAEVLDAPPVGAGDRVEVASSDSGLQVDRLTAGWPGATPVVTDLSFHVDHGERVALVGPSGVGKTTVAATIMGLIPPVAGEVRAGGRVGYLAQDAHIFATTLAENIRIGQRDADDEQVADALRRVGLAMSPDRLVGESGASLSGGEARRVALARVLVGDHDVLILDEPTEQLDAETAAMLMADVWQATRDLPVLVITHDERVIADCDRVVMLGQ